MRDKLKPGSKAFIKRQTVWKHNSFFGSVSMARQGMLAILHSKTATTQAKTLASCIRSDLDELYNLLKERLDAN